MLLRSINAASIGAAFFEKPEMRLTVSNVIKISANINTSYQMKVGNVIKIANKGAEAGGKG